MVCEVEDNGIGRRRSKELNERSLVKAESYGDHLIKDLIRIINEYEQMQISIEYIDKQDPETGTIVILTIQNAIHDK